MKHLLWITLFFINSLIFAQTGLITVTITSFKSNTGKAQIALYNNAEAFPTDPSKVYRTATVAIQNNAATITFDNLPYGNYAVAVFHDENSNNKLDTNWMGIPNEGLGASNNAKGHFGPPKFEDAKVNLNAAKLAVGIKIGY